MPDCIVAAAGRSRRMGRWKLGLRWESDTIVETVVRTALDAGCRVIVAGGSRFRRLRALLKPSERLVLMRIRRWRRGMDVTVRCALSAVQTDRFFVMAADMPQVQTEDYRRLAMMDRREAIRPQYNGVAGHPILFDAAAAQHIRDAPDGRPLRIMMRSLDVKKVDWHHGGVIQDVDTPEDYAQISADAEILP